MRDDVSSRPPRVAATGEPEDERREADEIRCDLVTHGERFADFGLEAHATWLREAGSVHPTLAHARMIIDTDVGGDPDDAVALAVAVGTVPELGPVVTSDERGGARARFARYLLDALGRPEVAVVSGRQLADTRYFCVEGLMPAEVPAQSTDVAGALRSLSDTSTGPLRWVGLGPASNLADLATTHPDLVSRLVVAQIGGRDPLSQARPNFRLGPEAAATMLRSTAEPHLVISDVTFRPQIEISADTPLYRSLADDTACGWKALVRANFDRWFAAFHPTSMLHDPLTLSASLQLPYVDFSLERVAVRPDGRMHRAGEGRPAFVSRSADYDAFMRWVQAGLEGTPAARR